jgi:2-hydroxychromene-2-carboxylate isomerase
MKIVGNRPTTIECRNKSKYAGADLQRWTRRYKVDFARNPHSKTFNFAELDRGALVAIEDGRGAEHVTAVFAAIWGKPEDLSQRSVLIDVLERAGFDAQRLLARASADAMIAQLEAETKAAEGRHRGGKGDYAGHGHSRRLHLSGYWAAQGARQPA